MPLMNPTTQRNTITYFPAYAQVWSSADYFLDVHNIFGPIQGVLGLATTEADVQIPAMRSGQFKKIKLKIISGTLTSNLTLNARINGVDSATTITITSFGAATYNLTPTETFVENDLLSIRMNSADNAGVHNVKFALGVEIQYA